MSEPGATLAQEDRPHGPGPGAWSHDLHVGRASALKLGMWIFLLSDAFSFAGLLVAYGVLRSAAAQWQPANEPALGIDFTAALTFVLICSSLTMVLALAGCQKGQRGRTIVFLGLTILGGIAFLIGQVHEYFGLAGHPGLIEQGLVLGGSHRATTFFVITGFHGLHVLTGVILLMVAFVKATLGRYDGGRSDAIESIGLFWHFVDLVWILVFTFVYLIPPAHGA